MLSIFKRHKKIENLKAFLDGKVIPITEVEDEIFSSKAMGDGVAIIPNSEVLLAPADGVVEVIMEKSFHAIGLKLDNGIELLLHIGLETVNMDGEGFVPLVKVGQKVYAGDRLIQFSKKIIKNNGYQDITMMVVTNCGDYSDMQFITGVEARAGETIISKL